MLLVPLQAPRNVTDLSLCYSVACCEWLQFPSLLAQCAKLVHLLIGQFSTSKVSALANRISNVVAIRPKKQVVRITARRIIAAMTHNHSFWDWPVRPFIHQSVCVRLFRFVSRRNEVHAVTGRSSRSLPYPTRIFWAFQYFLPEASNHVS